VLGIVKFRFPNKHDVYMHDTPERHLFSGSIRAFSHGCMRVQNPVKLAEVLLAHDKGWSTEQVQEYVRHGGEIKLTTPIPVHVTYFTAVVDDAGKTHYRSDIYGLDSRIASKLEGQSVTLATAGIDKPEAAEKTAAEPRPARQGRARAPQKAATSQSSNLFGTIFGN
jgi:murein L,D-transpeptidase YcbB/YkuD